MTHIPRRRRRAACLCLLLAAATACANGSTNPPAGSSTGVTDSPSPAPGDTWLAGLRVEDDPNALDADTRDLRGVLGGALIVSPASCFRGLPAEVDATAYVLGVQASTQAELSTLVAQTERDPAFEVRVQMLCTD